MYATWMYSGDEDVMIFHAHFCPDMINHVFDSEVSILAAVSIFHAVLLGSR